MIIRWKRSPRYSKSKRRWKHPEGKLLEDGRFLVGYTLVAVLVISECTNGKARQSIKQLGSINEDKLDIVGFRIGFWKAVDQHLAVLKVDGDTAFKIRAEINQRVPRPTVAELEMAGKELARIEQIIRENL